MILRIKSFWFGLSLPFKAAKVIFSNPALIFWSLLPVGLTLALYSYVIVYMQDQTRLMLGQAFVGWGLDPKGWMAWIALLLAKLLLFLMSALTFSLVATVLGSPFNDFLAEKAEPKATPPLAPVASLGWADRARMIGIDVLKTIAATGANLVAILFSWIPVLNFLALVATFLLVCFQYISYPQTRRGIGVQAGFGFLWKHVFACAGFGAACALFLAIPVVASFFLPLAVVGGTLLYGRAQQAEPRLY